MERLIRMPRKTLALLLLICLTAVPVTLTRAETQAAPDTPPQITPQDFYERFNMRTILSSVGPRLNYHCESFPFEFFSITEMTDDYLELEEDGYPQWYINFLGDNTIELFISVWGTTYRSNTEYRLIFDTETQQWRASTTFINIPDNCVPYKRTISPQGFYKQFNMRTIFSSIQPELRRYCGSFPYEYFSIVLKDYDYMELEIEGLARWNIRLFDGNRVRWVKKGPDGADQTEFEHSLVFDTETHQWRASETFIEVSDDCIPFEPAPVID